MTVAEKITMLQNVVKNLAGICDGAVTRDCAGFNKFDSEFGKSLAGRSVWTVKQIHAAHKMCRKYKRQIDPEVYATMYSKDSQKENEVSNEVS